MTVEDLEFRARKPATYTIQWVEDTIKQYEVLYNEPLEF